MLNAYLAIKSKTAANQIIADFLHEVDKVEWSACSQLYG